MLELFSQQSQYLALVPARGGSKSIHKKNIAPLNGKPLISYTLSAAVCSPSLSKNIFISTDSPEIAEVCSQLGFDIPFLRSSTNSTDTSASSDVIKEVITSLASLCSYVPPIIVLLQPTSPLRTYSHIEEAIRAFESTPCNSLVSVSKVPHQFTAEDQYDLSSHGYLHNECDSIHVNRQSKPERYSRNGAAIYIFPSALFLETGKILNPPILGFPMNKQDSIDIDDPFDMHLASLLLQHPFHG